MDIINGLPHTPYLIFIKGLIDKSDEEILNLLGLENTVEITMPKDYKDEDCIYLSRDDNWIHIMDNYRYTFWYDKKFSNRIDELGKHYEIYSCSVGECDCSFDFKYHKGGKKIREYCVESPNYHDEILKVDFGIPLLGENEGLNKKDQFDRVIHIARSLGIEVANQLKRIRCYKVKAENNGLKKSIKHIFHQAFRPFKSPNLNKKFN